MTEIKDPNLDGCNIIGYILGQYRWYRKLRGGYWWYSDCTDRWWRHKFYVVPAAKVEDYRK